MSRTLYVYSDLCECCKKLTAQSKTQVRTCAVINITADYLSTQSSDGGHSRVDQQPPTLQAREPHAQQHHPSQIVSQNHRPSCRLVFKDVKCSGYVVHCANYVCVCVYRCACGCVSGYSLTYLCVYVWCAFRIALLDMCWVYVNVFMWMWILNVCGVHLLEFLNAHV